MRFAGVNRTAIEKGFGAFKNVSGAVMQAGFPVCFTTTAASLDGISAVAPATGQLRTFAGIVTKSIDSNSMGGVADTEYGLYQAYGYNQSVRIFAQGGSVTIAVDSPMGPAAGSNGVNSAGLSSAYGPVIAMEAIGAAVNSPGGYARAFIRAL